MAKSAIVLGMFDGLHIGHRAVLRAAVDSPYKSVAVTFASLPVKGEGYLLSPDEKRDRLSAFGIDETLLLDFSSVRDLSPDAFLRFLAEKYDIQMICCGFNYRFGKNAAGDTAYLKRYCDERSIRFFACPAVTADGQAVSSTLIRNLIRSGEIARANELLVDPFSFSSPVVHGDKRGRTMGFPTINQRYDESLVVPRFGVYQTVVTIDAKRYDGVTNFGRRPTFQTDFISAETFVLDYAGDCYGKTVKTELLALLRPEKKFDRLDDLITAITANAEYVKANRKAKKD